MIPIANFMHALHCNHVMMHSSGQSTCNSAHAALDRAKTGNAETRA